MAKINNEEENKTAFDINEYKEEIDKYIKERIGIESEKEKDEIDKYIKERIEKESSFNSIKFYRRKIRNKNIAVFIEFIIIVFILGTLVVENIYLYNQGYLGKFYYEKNENKPVNNNDNNSNNKQDKKEEEKARILELINKYSYLIENIHLDTKSEYLTEYYSGNLTNELKEHLAFSLINNSNNSSDESSSYFDAELLKNAYNKLFSSELEYTDFKYDGASYKYIKAKDLFISTAISTTGNKIVKEIINVEEKDNGVIITTVEAYIKDNKLYNVLSNKEITDYKKDEKISKYVKKLNTVKYVFSNGLLESIK